MVPPRPPAVQSRGPAPTSLTRVTTLRPLEIPAGPAVLGVLAELRAALVGEQAFLPYAAGTPVPAEPHRRGASGPDPLPQELALAVATSGSTGNPKRALLTAAALRASADATHERLGGAGQWLLALPGHHIAGLQVLLRSLAAGEQPAVLEAEGFNAATFARAVSAMTGSRRHTSLVPTQLRRLLEDTAGRAALASLDAVLVGGAASPVGLLDRAREAGITVVATYGMSETAGGCVYDGQPLRCTRVRADAVGRLHLGGDTVAAGYLGRPELTAMAFTTDPDGARWFTTDDLGHQDADGRWHVDGRVDDLINSGGLKVAPQLVEDAIAAHLPGVAEVAVVGVPDPEWGQVVSAALVLRHGPPPTAADLRAALRGILPAHALPRRVLVTDALPVAGPGKPDRQALVEAFTTAT
jgi:O-succinylbenzoic acid--CoA ligase